jgi:hypothetical protein
VLCLLPLLVAGCASRAGSGGDQTAASSPGSTSAQPDATTAVPSGEDALLITVDAGDGTEPASYTLACAAGAPSTLPDAAAACDHLRGLDDPFAPLPADQLCTQQYDGPQTARITGRWAGADVRLELSRTDGCRISQWDQLRPLLPGPVG